VHYLDKIVLEANQTLWGNCFSKSSPLPRFHPWPTGYRWAKMEYVISMWIWAFSL